MAAAQRCQLGGIQQLIDVIDEHRGAVEFDLRARFGLPLDAVGSTLSWGESIRLIRLLASDPANWLTAQMQGWDHPWSRETMLLADIFDLTYRAAGVKKPKPYPRPWPERRDTRQLRPAPEVTQADIFAVLARAGHEPPAIEQRPSERR